MNLPRTVMFAFSFLTAAMLSGCEILKAQETTPALANDVGEDWRYVVTGATDETPHARNFGHIHLNGLPEVGFSLIGGQPALAGDFPATVYSSSGGARCTANIIGKQALLIAAHCVGDGKQVSFQINGVNYASICTHSPEYKNNETADWALCKATLPVAGIKYESINLDKALVKMGDKITLTGYGCTQSGGTGGNDGTLRVGEAPVTKVPSGTNYDIVTTGDVALCFGDSGGPAYKYLDTDLKARVQISVNSRGNIRNTSYLSSSANDSFKAFLTDWINRNSVEVCGVTPDAKDCRNGEIKPDPGNLPEWCGSALTKFQACLYGSPRLALSQPQQCRDTYATLFACEEAAEIPAN